MDTNVLLIVTVIIMAAAAVLTIIVGQSQGKKEGDSTYFVNPGRKLGRLLSIYAVVIVIVLIIFVVIMRG
ncbi:hypothetical protein [Cohnella luojiensis]|uniref:Uncharacterized protein n=1 Tax=Cohnella luojiensis TaxID=652876 RepID=A0A4Y8LTI2_9BACL|nr:hypothetical protein [Cohnella luojiensis]TFE22746.1 hypothetical protein E2980_20795 [Cohnella luojiensis]